jgi:hypothetical protein
MVFYGGIIIMKIKQQKNIKAFLNEEFGEKRGNDLFNKQEVMLNELIKNTQNKSKNQMKTLIQTILPRIAMYKVLSKEEVSEDEVYQYMRKYMIDKIAAKKHASTAKMEKVPGFYSIYSKVFLKIMRTTDLQESVQKHGKDYFDVTIKKCLWHTACVENDCEKLCHLFCDVDNVTYGGLKKIGFSRTKTLGYGGDCCDFHFYKK